MITPSLLALALAAPSNAPAAPSATLAAPAPTSHTAWHAAESLFYVELPDLVAARSEWSKTAIARMLADPEVHTALGELMGQEALDPVATLMGLARQSSPADRFDLATELLDALTAASFSVVPTETSRDVVADGIDDYETLLSAFGFQAIFTFQSDVAPSHLMDLVGEMLNQEGAEFELEELRWNGLSGALIRGLGPGELGDHVRLVRVGPHLILMAGVVGLEDVHQRMEGGGSPIATSEAWKKGATQFTGGGAIVADLYSDIMSYAPVEGDEVDPLFEMAEGLFGTNGSIATRGGRWRVTLQDGQYITNGFQPRDAQRPMEQILARGPLDPKAMSFVNPKAIVAWAVQFEPTAVVEAIRAKTGSDDGDLLTRLEADHGFKLADMILALGKSATFSMPTPPLMAAPDLQVSIALDDRDQFLAGLDALTAFLRKGLEGSGIVEIKDYRDVRLTTVEFTVDLGIQGLPVDPTKLIKPTIAVLEDRVLITTTQSFAKKVVRNAAKGEVEPHEYLQSVSIPEGVSEFGYADWAKMIGSLYSMGRSMGAMAASSLEPGTIPFDLTKLPDGELFLRHFKPSLRWEKRVDGGMLHHSESSFGPDLISSIVIAGLASTMAAPALIEARDDARELDGFEEGR